MGDSLLFLFSFSYLSQLFSFSSAYLRQSSFLFLFYLSSSSFLPTVKNLYVLGWAKRPSPAGSPLSGCSLLNESRRSSVSPSVPPPFSFCRSLSRHFLRRTFAGVFPLSSRKKFFYNFWIVLFRPSRFFQPRAARSPRVSFIPSSSAALPTATHIRLCFLLSRFHLVQPFLCYLAFSHGLSLSFRQRLCFLFWVNCTRSADWRSFN